MTDADYGLLLSQFQPSAEDKKAAQAAAIARMGLGILASNAPSATPKSTLGILAQGGLEGLGAYQSDLKNRTDERRNAAMLAMQTAKVRKELEAQEALKRFTSGGPMAAPDPAQTALAAGAAEGDVGPTVGNLARLDAVQANPNAVASVPNFDALVAAGVPGETVKALQESWKLKNPEMKVDGGFAYNPRTIRPGFLPQVKISDSGQAMGLTPGANGGLPSVAPLPGSIDAYGQFQRAGAGATAAYDLVDVPDGRGGTQKMPREQAVRLLTGRISGSPQAPQVPQAQAPSQIIGTPLRLGYQPDQATLAGARTTAEEQAKGWVQREQNLRQSWSDANGLRGQLDMIEHLSRDPNVASGALAENISGLKSIAESLGIKTQGLPAEEVIKGITTEMALKQKNQGGTNMMPGAMSDFEQKLLKSMTPQLAQAKEGRFLMIQVFKAKTERDQQIAEMAANYVDKHGKLDNGFEREVRAFAKANPMFSPEKAKAMQELARRLGNGQ